MRKSIVPLVVLVALAGCGPPQRDQAPAKAEPPSGVTVQMMTMGDKERNIVFIRALLDANMACDGVTKSERIADMQGVPYWKAYCKNGSSHLITVTKDGTAKIISHS